MGKKRIGIDVSRAGESALRTGVSGRYCPATDVDLIASRPRFIPPEDGIPDCQGGRRMDPAAVPGGHVVADRPAHDREITGGRDPASIAAGCILADQVVGE